MTTSITQTTHFQETQTFPKWLFLIPIISLMVMLTVVFLDMPTLLDIFLPVVLLGGVTLLIILSRLFTEVKDDGLYQIVSFPQNKRFTFDTIVSATARQYSAIGEYGGWGIRYGFDGTGRAYNTKGNHGVQLVFNDGKKLLIGSQRAEVLAQHINQHLSH